MNDLKKIELVLEELFLEKKSLSKKKYIKIDPRNRGEFVYHIIKFLLINLNKFMTGKILLKKKFWRIFS